MRKEKKRQRSDFLISNVSNGQDSLEVCGGCFAQNQQVSAAAIGQADPQQCSYFVGIFVDWGVCEQLEDFSTC